MLNPSARQQHAIHEIRKIENIVRTLYVEEKRSVLLSFVRKKRRIFSERNCGWFWSSMYCILRPSAVWTGLFPPFFAPWWFLVGQYHFYKFSYFHTVTLQNWPTHLWTPFNRIIPNHLTIRHTIIESIYSEIASQKAIWLNDFVLPCVRLRGYWRLNKIRLWTMIRIYSEIIFLLCIFMIVPFPRPVLLWLVSFGGFGFVVITLVK